MRAGLKARPVWQFARGLPEEPADGIRFGKFGMIRRHRMDPSQPGVVKIVLVTPDGEELSSEHLPSTSTDEEICGLIEDVLGKLNAPFARIRTYRGTNLIHDEELEIRE